MGIFTTHKKKRDTAIEGKKGVFIVIDGTDGSGKTTQTELLRKTLTNSGFQSHMFDFPQYNKPSSAMLMKYLQGELGELDAKQASILFAVDRFDASFEIRQRLQNNDIILTNRYVTSNAGHQGGKITDATERHAFFRWLNNLEFEIFKIPKPDLTILLHVPLEMTLELIRKGHQAKGTAPDIHDQDLEHLRRAEQVYLEIAELFPSTFLIECAENGKLLTEQEIHTKVWEIVRRIALKDFPPNQL